MQPESTETFCGQVVSQDQLGEIVEIVDTFSKLSRAELANTICELFSWKRPTGKLKTVECRQFLEDLDARGIIRLPATREKHRKPPTATVPRTPKAETQAPISAKLSELLPISLAKVETKSQRQLWYEYVDRYHYLGYQLPFGAQLRYFIKSGADRNLALGCLQFSSPAWQMAPRDRWIGWDSEQRQRTGGSAGTASSASATCKRLLITAAFLYFPGFRLKILPVQSLAWQPKQCPTIGKIAMPIGRL
jgi:hypothetical protein